MPASKKKSIETTFTFDKDTPGTFRYKEDGDEPVIGTLYVKKAAFSAAPAKLTVTVVEV